VRELQGSLNPQEAGAGFRIFIVEDEAIVADDLAITLKGLGYGIAGTANSGETAIGKILAADPDLVLMDIHLKGTIDGVEAAARIHEQSDVPVIYLTAYADATLLGRAKLTAPYGYIIKPYDERELHSVIEMARYKYRLDRQLRESEEKLRKLNEELEIRIADRTASLRHQLEFLQQLIDTIPAPVYYKDTAGVYLGCNHAFEAYTGIRKGDILGKTDAALFSSDMASLSTEKDSQLITRQGIQVYQARFPHTDNSLRDVIFKKATFRDGDGSIAGFIGVMIDISDRVRSEELLQVCEDRLQAITGDLTELVYRCTPDRTCVFANPAFLRYFNRRAEETAGYLFTPPVHPEDAPRVQQLHATLTQESPVLSYRCRILLPDSSTRQMEWTVRAFFDTSGHVCEYQYVGQEAGAGEPPGP
jgi:PAS domain S-box-containing protein